MDTFGAALASFPCLHAASWLPESSQYFARYEVHGVKVEMSTVERQVDSDGMECVGRGPWQHYVWIACGSHQVPAVRLELRLATELVRDRADRYEPLLDHMSAHGCDFSLLHRAMRTRACQRNGSAWSGIASPPPLPPLDSCAQVMRLTGSAPEVHTIVASSDAMTRAVQAGSSVTVSSTYRQAVAVDTPNPAPSSLNVSP